MKPFRLLIDEIRTANAFARIFKRPRGPVVSEEWQRPPDVAYEGDLWATPWQWTPVTPVLVGGSADGIKPWPELRRCHLPDTIATDGACYRIGIYRDAHTVEYVPA